MHPDPQSQQKCVLGGLCQGVSVQGLTHSRTARTVSGGRGGNVPAPRLSLKI